MCKCPRVKCGHICMFIFGELTCPTRPALYEEHRRLLQALRPVTDPLQLADAIIRDPIASTNRLAALAHAHSDFPSPPDCGGVPHSSVHRTLQTFSTHRVTQLTHPTASFSFSGRAHQAAVAMIHHLPRRTVLWHRRAHGLITETRTAADHIPFTVSLQRCYQDADAK